MEKEELFDKAEEYIKGQLSKRERLLFEKEMVKDDAITEEVNLYSQIIKANSEKDTVDLRSAMKRTLQEQHQGPVRKNKGRISYRTLIIIGFLLLILCVIVILFKNIDSNQSIKPQEVIEQPINIIDIEEQIPTDEVNEAEEQFTPHLQNDKQPIAPVIDSEEPNSKKSIEEPPQVKDNNNNKEFQAIAMAYYEVPKSILSKDEITERGIGVRSKSSIIDQAREAFSDGLNSKELNKEQSEKYFEESVALLSSLIEKNQNTKAIFYRAHALFQLAQYDDATIDFESASKSRNFKQQGEWGLVITQLMLGNNYQNLLDTIITNPSHDFQDKAIALKKSLGN